jgi:hypothetical protein
MFAASVIVALFSMARASSGPSSVGVGAADTQAANRATAAVVNFMMGRWRNKNKILAMVYVIMLLLLESAMDLLEFSPLLLWNR